MAGDRVQDRIAAKKNGKSANQPSAKIPCMEQQGKLLMITKPLALLQVRKNVLEIAGFTVVPATDLREVQEACAKNEFELAIIGHWFSRKEKKNMCQHIVASCRDTQILELFEAAPDIPEADHHLNAREFPSAIPHKISEILRSKPQKRNDDT